MRPRCSIWSAPGTSTPASPTRRPRFWRNGLRRWKPASAPSARRAAWPRCTSPSPRSLSAGDHIVASASLYGGTINLLAHTLPRFGITTTFVKPRDLDGFRAAIRPEHPARHRRDHRQSGPRGARHPAGRRHRPCRRHSAPDRQHVRHALSQPAGRARRRHRDAFHHQMDRRPRHRDRRRHRRRRPFRLCSPRASFPPSPSPMPAITASSSARNSARRPSSCGRAPRACAISAPACRRPMPSTCCKASRPCRCACSATWRTRRRCSIS